MKKWEEINPRELLTVDDFLTLFEKAPLNEEEKLDLKGFYFPMYETFVQSDVTPENAWLAVRNVFVMKNPQITDRIKKEEKSPLRIVKNEKDR